MALTRIELEKLLRIDNLMVLFLLLKTKRENYGLAQITMSTFMMEKHLPFSPITVNLLKMFVQSSKIKKVIFGWVELMAFGVMTVVHLRILRRGLLVI